jgi:isocitrate dehydrogenase
MVYIKGEEMTEYVMKLVLERWVGPYVDTSSWEHYDLSCKARDDSEDGVLRDAVTAGARLKAIFKEPTITPTEVQKARLGLKKAWGSPNGAMRRGWNGVTISRDTIHIDGLELGFKRPVLFERHAVGGEYSAGHGTFGPGKVTTTFTPADGSAPVTVVETELKDASNAVVTYHNPYDNVPELGRIFFERCLLHECVPYVVTKKTVFKWQETFWTKMKEVFDAEFKGRFAKAGLLDGTGGELQHLISDAATMQIVKWTDGGFGMAAHNYDGDMLTDEVAQVHKSPGFITSNLVGKAADGSLIKEFEASHGTAADMDEARMRGDETSFNPLGMVEALIGAMQHAAALNPAHEDADKVVTFTNDMRRVMHKLFREGKGTRDLCGPTGLTTEAFIDAAAAELDATYGK